MFRQRAFQQREVQPRDVLGHVDQRVVGDRVEEHVGVAQAEVEIHQDDGVLRILGEDAAEIDRQAGRAHAADGAGHGDHLAAAGAVLAVSEAAFADPSQGRQRSSIRTGWVRNSLAPARSAWRIKPPSFDELTTSTAQSGEAAPKRVDQFQRLLRIGVDGHQADVGIGLGHHVGEELVARTLGFQPDHVHSQQHALQRFALGVVGINDG